MLKSCNNHLAPPPMISQKETLFLKGQLALQYINMAKLYFDTKITTLPLPSNVKQKIRQYTTDIASQKQHHIPFSLIWQLTNTFVLDYPLFGNFIMAITIYLVQI